MSKVATMFRRDSNTGAEEKNISRNNPSVDPPGAHEISELAYQRWVERGCPVGSPDEDWFRAEEELLHRQA